MLFQIIEGDNAGDTVHLERGICRLVGRHLGEHETVMLAHDGTRLLDAKEIKVFESQMEKALNQAGRVASFKRGADIILADETVSRAHAMLFFDDLGVGVIDLASTNGTYVNGDAQPAMLLQRGDRVKMGNTVLVLE